MDARSKVVVAVALLELKKLQERYADCLSAVMMNASEEDERRRRLLITAALRARGQIVLKAGGQWEAMLNADDDAFRRHFGLSKAQFASLLTRLQERGVAKEHSQGLPPVPASKRVLMFLWYMANQNSFREMSDRFDVSPSSAHRIVLGVLAAVCAMGPTFVSWPDAGERASSAAAFQRVCGLGGVIGAVDGCHVRVQRPAVRGGDYMNGRCFYSVLLQAIVDERGRFLDVFAGPPGRLGDARMLRASSFYDARQEMLGEYRLLGDSAYFDQGFPFIVACKPDDGALSEAELQQNRRISRGRAVVDQALGRLKCRWRRLRDLQNTRLDAVVMVVLAACFLHNVCAEASETCPDHPHGCPREEDGNE
uniref:Protein ALP1-like n=1 Tax=Fundulus heteroclitus TaxID=8078 RepID=A0A3Q2QA82_FUNHE